MMEIKAVLFDMDGVLIDSEGIMLRAAVDSLKEYGVEAAPEDMSPEYIGGGEERFLGGLAGKHGVKYVPGMKALAYEYYGRYIAEADDVLYCDESKLLRSLKGKYKLALCSAADLVKVRHNIHKIGVEESLFDCIISGDDVTKFKPDPEVFLKAAERINVAPENCLVVEDSVNGILAAKAGGMLTAGVTTSFTAEELRREAAPDQIISTVAELEKIFDRQN
ncbi:MAG: HAD family phosphatase [Clostridiales bacterium]|nr:HAD family phosphatase [Clostridiales bacterium]